MHAVYFNRKPGLCNDKQYLSYIYVQQLVRVTLLGCLAAGRVGMELHLPS
jgi:hypothetical protein